MRTITQELKKYEELSKEDKAQVIEKYRDINVGDWYDDFYLEDLQSDLKKVGFLNAEIHYSGFWSQGDGASFDAEVDIIRYLEATTQKTKYKKLLNMIREGEIEAYIRKNSWSNNYSHEKTRYIELELFVDDISDDREDLISYKLPLEQKTIEIIQKGLHKVIWGDKTPSYMLEMPLLNEFRCNFHLLKCHFHQNSLYLVKTPSLLTDYNPLLLVHQ